MVIWTTQKKEPPYVGKDAGGNLSALDTGSDEIIGRYIVVSVGIGNLPNFCKIAMLFFAMEFDDFFHAVPSLDKTLCPIWKNEDDFVGRRLGCFIGKCSILEFLAKQLIERSVIIGFVVSDTIVRFAVCAGSRRKQEKGGTKEGGQ